MIVHYTITLQHQVVFTTIRVATNSGNFETTENLRETQGVFKLYKISGKLREFLRLKEPRIFFTGSRMNLINLVSILVQTKYFYLLLSS